MIQSKEDFKRYVAADRARYPYYQHGWRARWDKMEEYYLVEFLYRLRKVEYLKNCCKDKNLFWKGIYLFHYHRYRRMVHQHLLNIAPNVCGPGLYLPHLGRISAPNNVQIGANCTLRPENFFAKGMTAGDTKTHTRTVGDNVEFSTGCKILCTKIGNNVLIGPNAVVMRNVPDDSMAVGNPAKIMPRISFSKTNDDDSHTSSDL